MYHHPYIIYYIVFIFCSPITSYCYSFYKQPKTKEEPIIMIDPAGDTNTPGRLINESFERTITLQWARLLKSSLEQQEPNARIFITRSPTDKVEPLQNAQYANRMGCSLFISLHCYTSQEPKPVMQIYSFSYGHIFTPQHKNPFVLYPYQQAYIRNIDSTRVYAEIIKQKFIETKQWQTYGIYSLPCKPLIGITAPAIALEIGIAQSHLWQETINSLVESIVQILTIMQQ